MYRKSTVPLFLGHPVYTVFSTIKDYEGGLKTSYADYDAMVEFD